MTDRSQQEGQTGRDDAAVETEAVEAPGMTEGEALDLDAAAEGAGAAGDDLRAELERSRDKYLRLAAEYDNFRKRTERERTESWSRAQAQLVEKLLDSLDDLERVAEHSSETATPQSLLEGFQLVENKLMRVLEAAGLEVLEPAGEPFDPALHEGLMTTPAESEEDDDTVGLVLQKGYRFKGILLRPARVQVRKHGG